MTEANYWRQRYEMLMATFMDALKAATDTRTPIMLGEIESYNAGLIAGMSKRKPLTDSQIIKATMGIDTGKSGYFIAIARAIEAAHEIKD